MANRYRNLIYSTAEYTHSYNGFRGVELNASSVTSSPSRLAYAQNMYKDYDGDGAEVIESVPGYRCFAHYGKPIHAIYYQRSPYGNQDHLLVHVGNEIVRHPISDTHGKNTKGKAVATAKSTKSFGFEYGRHFYVMDTEKILQISDDGSARVIGEGSAVPYVPTTHVSGEEYEQRNLLTDRFKEDFYVADPRAYLFASEGLEFTVTDPNLRYCALSGINGTPEGEIYVPTYVNLGEATYKVTAIAERALFGNTAISAVYLSDGIISIGKEAFSGCSSLHTVVISSTVTSVNDRAFANCSLLSTLYLGASVNYIGVEVFDGCSRFTAADYALGEDDLKKINGYEVIRARTVRYGSTYKAIRISLPLHNEVESVDGVTVDGEDAEWILQKKDGRIKAVSLNFTDTAQATGIRLTVSGTLSPLDKDWASDMNSLSEVTPYQAIVNCRTAEVFDGRIFFSGNPDFPNTVFYTERARQGQDGALYVGRYNYFNDGVGSYKVTSMLAVRDMLAVFKEGDDGSGSIFYHKKEGVDLGPIDTVYPVAYVHSGICSSGACLSFLDDPVFLTDEGLMALNNENINYQRNVVCRSHNVNYSLLKEDLSKTYLCEWLGYLAVGSEGKIFLADSRSVFTHPTGAHEYEWFLITDVGAYNGDKRVYRYAADAYADAIVNENMIGEAVDAKDVYSVTDENGVNYFYVYLDGTKYRVIQTEELTGGDFYPATVFTSHGKLMFFATDDGHLCVFNNDMRGVAPESLKASPEYDEEAYLATMANKLHPSFYSFAGHAPKYLIRTSLDNCGVPHLTKNTVRKSLVVKAKSVLSDAIRCEVRSDEKEPVYVGSFPAVPSGFDDFSFDYSPWYVGRYASSALSENEKRWIEKQVVLYADAYSSPISVYSMSYRYTIKGKIKNNV